MLATWHRRKGNEVNVRRLEDQVALVTGAASGIGLATADALAKEGAHIAVIDREAPGVDQAAKALEQAGGTARPYLVDLADASAIGPVVTSVLADFGRIDVLVN